MELERFDEAIEWCDEGLAVSFECSDCSYNPCKKERSPKPYTVSISALRMALKIIVYYSCEQLPVSMLGGGGGGV